MSGAASAPSLPDILAAQRNEALDALAMATVRIAQLEREVASLRKTGAVGEP